MQPSGGFRVFGESRTIATQGGTDGSGAMQAGPWQTPELLNSPVERRELRKETNWIAMIRLLDGTEIACNVKDVSPSGAKLGIPSAQDLPETFMLKIVGRDFVCLVRQAWRRGNFVGVRIEKIGKLAADRRPEPTSQDAPAYKSVGPRHSKISSF